MKTEETTETNILQKVTEKLLAAQQEIDELALQLALGKADARDKFEEIKSEFRLKVGELKNILANPAENYLSPEVKAKIEELELQLALGKADSKDLFEGQKKKIMNALTNLEEDIQKNWRRIKAPDFFVHEVEQFKLKMEILRLRFRLKKFDVRDDYRTRMQTVRREIKKMTSKAKDRINARQEKYDDFKFEISLAYKHIKNAVESLN
ncbi:MAG TPA: hypothetical protein PKJ83_08215 [Cyclobacteriaceae bacterium]|nr:hypothetical protein [Cyclobacteriaceae bacterium]HPW62141.1 hypothetical protein [Cyclobacteriaceae bacterium]